MAHAELVFVGGCAMPDSDWVKYRRMRGKPLPESATLLGTTTYTLRKLLKDDFYAAIGVYDRSGPATDDASQPQPEQVILKVYHTDRWGVVPLGWLGRSLCRREARFYQTLHDVDGVPRYLGPYADSGMVREYVPGCNLREYLEKHRPGRDFFDRLRAIVNAVHARGIAHADLSKPENVLVRPDGTPALIDFQIALRKGSWPLWGWPGGVALRYMQRVDHYHLTKRHRRSRKEDFSADEIRAARRKGVLLTVHGWVRRPYRAVRHLLLRRYLIQR